MTLKEALSKLVNNRKQERDTEKEFERIQRIKLKYEAKQKSANERELERNLKSEREQYIKEELKITNKMRENDSKLNSPTNQPNVFNGHTKLNTVNLFSNHPNIFSNKSIFGGHYA